MSLESLTWISLNYSKRLLKFLVGLKPIGCFLKLQIFPGGDRTAVSGVLQGSGEMMEYSDNIQKIFIFQFSSFSIFNNCVKVRKSIYVF